MVQLRVDYLRSLPGILRLVEIVSDPSFWTNLLIPNVVLVLKPANNWLEVVHICLRIPSVPPSLIDGPSATLEPLSALRLHPLLRGGCLLRGWNLRELRQQLRRHCLHSLRLLRRFHQYTILLCPPSYTLRRSGQNIRYGRG